MRDFWIRFKAGFRGSVIAPLRGFSAPLQGLVITPDGKPRWVPIGGLVFLGWSLVSGLSAASSRLWAVSRPLPRSRNRPHRWQRPQPPATRPYCAGRCCVEPRRETHPEGRIPFLSTTSPGELAEAYTRARLNMNMGADTAQGWLDAEAEWRTGFVPAGFEDWAWTANDRPPTALTCSTYGRDSPRKNRYSAAQHRHSHRPRAR